MDMTIVSALAGIVGSLCGGSASVATAWVTQKTLNKRKGIRAEVNKREALYGEFINEWRSMPTHAKRPTANWQNGLESGTHVQRKIRLAFANVAAHPQGN